MIGPGETQIQILSVDCRRYFAAAALVQRSLTYTKSDAYGCALHSDDHREIGRGIFPVNSELHPNCFIIKRRRHLQLGSTMFSMSRNRAPGKVDPKFIVRDFEPVYLKILRQGKIAARIETAIAELEDCCACPRQSTAAQGEGLQHRPSCHCFERILPLR